MKKLSIINHAYYRILIGVLGGLMLNNIYATFTSRNLIGILPILLQSVLIYLLFTKNTFSQKAVKIWVIVVFFVAQTLGIIAIVIQAWAKNIKGEEGAFEMLASDKIIYSTILIIIGIILWILNNGFAEIKEENAIE
ncbi:MAG: hypothetical protein KDC49_02340 [Saprospiraceae bacterium]|nr:hypothetical protein [Saprospiraceae bacterium]